MDKQDLALNKLQGLTYCKTQPTNQPTFIAITPRSTLTQSVYTCYSPLYGSNRSV